MTINSNSSDKQREPATSTRRPYRKPEFKFEQVFEVSALACGKVHATESSCHFSRKAS